MRQAASKGQSLGIEKVNAVVAQSSAASAEENAAAAEELNAQVESMRESVSVLSQLLGGKGQLSATAAASSTGRNQRVNAGAQP